MDILVLFARYPEQGKVKTRLAQDIGAAQALQLYKGFIEHLLQEHQHRAYTVLICFTPATMQKQCAELWNVPLLAQHGKDLGERMQHAFKTLLPKYTNVIIIGTDLPDLSYLTDQRPLSL